MRPERWKAGVKVVAKTIHGRISCTNLGRQVNYDKIARRPNGCGPLSVFETISTAFDWISWMGIRERPWLSDGSLEVIPCVYKVSFFDKLWVSIIEEEYKFMACGGSYTTGLGIPGTDYADVVVSLNMGEITEIREIT